MASKNGHAGQPQRVILGPDGQPVEQPREQRTIEAHRAMCPICRRRGRLRGEKVARAERAIAFAEEQHLMQCQLCAELTASDQPFALCPKMAEIVKMRLDTVGRVYCPRGRALLLEAARAGGLVLEDGPPELEQAVDDVEDDVESGLD
jgi:hypothetical protein